MPTAGTDDSGYSDPVIDRGAGNKIDQVSFVSGMITAVVSSTTIRTGFQFRTEIGHKSIKQRFR